MPDEKIDGVAVAILAYESILAIRPNSRAYGFRVVNQSLLAHLRDYIAQETGMEPEAVQTKYEQKSESRLKPNWSADMERYLKPGEPTDEEWAAALKREKLNG